MSFFVTICDDSSLARLQVARSLDEGWNIELNFAVNGQEGIDAVEQGKADLLLLDLTMPDIDGYQVLKHIQDNQLETQVIVISGDIQPEAQARVKQLGALGFIRKPVEPQQLITILDKNGLLETLSQREPDQEKTTHLHQTIEQSSVSIEDSYQEIANVAMGRAADLLARLLNAFVILPVPRINTIERAELHMALELSDRDKSVFSVCQGFIGGGVSGEALAIFSDSSFSDIAKLVKFDGEIDNSIQLELVMDIASILVGAFLKAFAEQLDLNFSHGHPIILGEYASSTDFINRKSMCWEHAFSIEVAYRLEGYDVNCDMLILFTEDSMDTLNNRVELYSA